FGCYRLRCAYASKCARGLLILLYRFVGRRFPEQQATDEDDCCRCCCYQAPSYSRRRLRWQAHSRLAANPLKEFHRAPWSVLRLLCKTSCDHALPFRWNRSFASYPEFGATLSHRRRNFLMNLLGNVSGIELGF